MKKFSSFKVLFHYLRDEKLKLFIYILLVALTYLPSLATAFFWGLALEKLISKDFSSFVLYLVIWEGIYIFFYTVLQVPRDKLYNYLEIKFMKSVSFDLYKKIDCLPARAFEEIGVGEFINRLYTDPDRVMELLQNLIKLICKSFVIILVLILAFSISILLGFEILLFAFIMGFISYKFFPKIKSTQENIKKESDNYVKVATENITGIREIKSLGIKKNIENNVFGILNNLFKHQKEIRSYEVIYYSLNNLVYFILQFLILFTAGYYMVHGHIAYSIFVMLSNYIWRIDEVVESISDFGVNYNKVKFKYSEDEDYTLKGLSMKLEPGRKIAIVGRSGNGKSTIFNLLLRYFDTSIGSITVDGVNINDLSEKSLRDSISIIRQTPFLFNLSIIDNFKLTKEDVTLDEIRDVCKKAYIDDYIMSLPNKYETIIGEGGINLSGGQKQRLAIARTLLLNTKIILFDEATSALDNESQNYIKKTIDNLVKDHTVIIVAHRLSTIVDAEIIYVIDKGKLADSGTHRHLLNKCSVYKKLYQNETSDSE